MQTDQAPPVAKTVPYETTRHGETRTDPYFWLRDRSDPDVVAYLEAENAHTEAVLADAQALRRELYEEMKGRIKETDETVPVRRGPYLYSQRTEEGRQYPVYLRRRDTSDAPEEMLLDQNALAEGHPYCRLGAFEVGPDQRLLAYSVDNTGAEKFTLFVKDLETGELLPDRVPDTYYGVAWAEDGRTVYYTVLDEAMRPFKLYRHVLGQDPAEDALVYHEPDEAYFVSVSKTRSRAYLLLTLESNDTTEVRFLPADRPEGEFVPLEPRRKGVEYSVDHHGDRFLIVTNDGAKNFKLVEAPVSSPGRASWRELIPHRPDVLLDGIDAFRDHLAVYEREAGLKRIRLTDPDARNARSVEFPEPVYTYRPGPNEEFDSATLRFTYTSLVTPNSVIDYDMGTGAWVERKREEIPSGYDPSLYASERLSAEAPDGARVPISLVYRADTPRDGSAPLLLYGYGSYGFSTDPAFSANRLSLLDRGWIFAMAHVRGGSELGREWYEQGKLLHKKNTFTDFIACAEYLVTQGYARSDRLAIQGGSAGGLLMGAVVNARPELFGAVILAVPFVDVINTMCDPTLPLTMIEYDEWGDPNDRTYYDYMLSYSPYDNVEAKDYPAMLFLAGLNDPRVAYWEPAKMAAKLRATKTDRNPLLLKTEMGAGHGGPSGRYDYLHEVALQYAFLLRTVGAAEAGG